MAERLTIGVTGPGRRIPWAWYATRWQLHRAGANARRLTAATGMPAGDLAGFIIGGGNDIDPAIYGGDVSASRTVDPLRDEFELEVLELAALRGLPVMGICRGAQLINVHGGGTLVGDLRPHRVHTSNRGTLLPRKAVRIDPGTTLAEFIGGETTRVNSLHHQAVDRTGANLAVTACDRDDIVQGIESTTGPLRLGVQWHPEYLPQRADQRRLFRYFVDACRSLTASA
jgi:putative glutamine amidotransferase